jgi:hypothetical protein
VYLRLYRAPVLRNWLTPAAWVAAVVALLLLVFPLGFPNYDTIYALVWGRELAHGVSPDYGAVLPPTPHPLADLVGLVATPLGDGAIGVTMAIAYLSLGLVGYLVYRLGSLWFDRPIGAVAALIVLTRAPYLSNGLRAYVDLPYIALVLGALVIETRRPRAGWPVLALLVPAGLLRPEAWLFSLAYLAYLLLDFSQLSKGRGEKGKTSEEGDGVPLEPADTQKRGLIRPRFVGARRLGEVLQWPGMVGALGGVVLGLAFLRRRSEIGVAAIALALGAFAIVACGGLAILPRYTMLSAAMLAIFVALALLGWRLLERGHPWRRAWQAFAAFVALMFVVWAPNQYDLLHRVDTDLANQGKVESDLTDLDDSGAFEPLCGEISVPNHRAVPRLSFNLEVRPSRIVSSSEQAQPRRGYFLAPAGPFTIHNFILDPNDPARFETKVPHGFHRVAANSSWILYRRC